MILSAPATGHGALYQGGALVDQRSGTGRAGALEAGALGRGQGQRNGAGQEPVEHDVGEGGLQVQGDPPAGELLADRVVLTSVGDRAGGVDRALDLHPGRHQRAGSRTVGPVAGRQGERPGRAAGPGRCWSAGTAGSRCWPSRLRCTVVSIHNVSVCPARCGPSQNCWPHSPRFPQAGTIRSISTASMVTASSRVPAGGAAVEASVARTGSAAVTGSSGRSDHVPPTPTT
jgi:hypothetical protein